MECVIPGLVGVEVEHQIYGVSKCDHRDARHAGFDSQVIDDVSDEGEGRIKMAAVNTPRRVQHENHVEFLEAI